MDNNRFSDAEPRVNEEEKGRGMMDTRWVVGLDWIGLDWRGRVRLGIGYFSLFCGVRREERTACVRMEGVTKNPS